MDPIHPDDPRNDPRTDLATIPTCTAAGHRSHWLAYAVDGAGNPYWYCRIIGKPVWPEDRAPEQNKETPTREG